MTDVRALSRVRRALVDGTMPMVEDEALTFSAPPVLGNADFGHTHPMLTLLVGGQAEPVVDEERSRLRLTSH